jgi:hypothetical protein
MAVGFPEKFGIFALSKSKRTTEDLRFRLISNG